MCHVSNLLFLGIPLLYYYISLNSSITCCLSFGDIYLSFGISLLPSVGDNFSSRDYLEVLVILSAVLLPIRSPVASAVF